MSETGPYLLPMNDDRRHYLSTDYRFTVEPVIALGGAEKWLAKDHHDGWQEVCTTLAAAEAWASAKGAEHG